MYNFIQFIHIHIREIHLGIRFVFVYGAHMCEFEEAIGELSKLIL